MNKQNWFYSQIINVYTENPRLFRQINKFSKMERYRASIQKIHYI